MKPRQLGWKWLLLGLVVAALAVSALLPGLLPDTSQFGNRVAEELSAWTGGKVKITGPIRVRYFPDVSVRGRFELAGGTRLPLVKSIVAREAKISLSLFDLLQGRISIDALRLIKPRIVLKQGASPGAPAEPSTLADTLFAAGSIRVVHVRDGILAFRTANGTEAIKHIYAHFDGSEGAGVVSSFGSFMFRNETVNFALDSGALTKGADASVLPVVLALTSGPINARLTGRASFGSAFQLEGDMQSEIENVRRLLAWAGIELPNGESLRRFSAGGAFHLTGSTLTFDDGTFTLDGNRAVGLLAVTGGARPRVEGTLAFDRLALDPYVAQDGADGKQAASNTSSILFDEALLRHFDADLRISAGAIEAGTLKLGHGGFTITAEAGVLSGEVSELELCGGSASGRFGADISQATKRLTLMASLADITVDSCLEPLGLGFPLKGVGVVKTEVTTEGRDAAEFLHGLSGSLKVKARGGTVPVDLSRLLTTAPLERDGWSVGNATAFDLLDADCRLAAGHVSCQTFNMQTPRGIVSGSGDVDLSQQTLDWNLSVTSQLNQVKSSQLTAANLPKVSIRGSLSQPMIRRADSPTLGEGAAETGSLAPAVSQR
jgi:AsmA protein